MHCTYSAACAGSLCSAQDAFMRRKGSKALCQQGHGIVCLRHHISAEHSLRLLLPAEIHGHIHKARVSCKQARNSSASGFSVPGTQMLAESISLSPCAPISCPLPSPKPSLENQADQVHAHQHLPQVLFQLLLSFWPSHPPASLCLSLTSFVTRRDFNTRE